MNHQVHERLVNAAVDMRFEAIYIREVDDRELVPDFDYDWTFD